MAAPKGGEQCIDKHPTMRGNSLRLKNFLTNRTTVRWLLPTRPAPATRGRSLRLGKPSSFPQAPKFSPIALV